MAPHGNPHATVMVDGTFGSARLEPDPARRHGWTLFADGVPQSYVDLADPRYLAYEYVRRLATVLDLAAPAGVPLRVLHLGGGGLTLPRYVTATRPGSAQRVIERDAALIALVDEVLGRPAGVEVEVGDARQAVAGPGPRGYDVVVVDVFAGAAMPDSVAGTGFARAVAGLLASGGLAGVNLTDVPPLAWTRTLAATLRTAFGDVALIAGAGMVRGRRAGNVVLVAGAQAGDLPVARLAAAAARDREPGRVLHAGKLDTFLAGARPHLDTPM